MNYHPLLLFSGIFENAKGLCVYYTRGLGEMGLKLQKIEIENYGNLQKVSLKNLRQLNILIGPNNSGKTHILQAINKLKGIDVNYPRLKSWAS